MYIYSSGDYYIKVIPVPMPNTEVKLYVPKILANFFAGKIGRRQIFKYSSLAQSVERSAVKQIVRNALKIKVSSSIGKPIDDKGG